MANPFIGGGDVHYEPGRVVTPLDLEITRDEETTARKLALERDQIAADLLETDESLDLLDAAIDDQMKGMQLPAGEIADAARKLCGSSVITWECYKKAKALLQAAPMILNGFDPVQLVFTDKITPRKGPVLFNCRDFDPEKFFDATYDTPGGNTSPEGSGGLDPSEIQKIAQENQKKWALLILFWNLLWGKPKINPKRLAEIEKQQENFTQLQEKVQALATAGKKSEAEALAKTLGMAKLPDLIREGRPAKVEHCLWEGKSGTELENVATDGKRAPNAAAVWCTPGHPSEYKNKGIPVMESGFILPILIGFLSIPPKVMLGVLKLHEKLTKKFIGLKKVPVAGKKLYKAWEGCTGLIFMPAYYINNIFIEACIWLALKPRGYVISVGEMDGEAPLDVSIDEKTTANLEIVDTPGGFVPIDCLTAAQEIVNKVNANAIQ